MPQSSTLMLGYRKAFVSTGGKTKSENKSSSLNGLVRTAWTHTPPRRQWDCTTGDGATARRPRTSPAPPPPPRHRATHVYWPQCTQWTLLSVAPSDTVRRITCRSGWGGPLAGRCMGRGQVSLFSFATRLVSNSSPRACCAGPGHIFPEA